MLKVTVSGSFHRNISEIYLAVSRFRAAGLDVISPVNPTIVDQNGEFLFVASDVFRSVKLVQDRHFESIRASDFLWVVCPDGYTGSSTSAEIGAAHVCGTPVFSDNLPTDTTLKYYVRKVNAPEEAATLIRRQKAITRKRTGHFLLDPIDAIDQSMRTLDNLRSAFISSARDEAFPKTLEYTRKILNPFR